jgi:hypothetical protein
MQNLLFSPAIGKSLTITKQKEKVRNPAQKYLKVRSKGKACTVKSLKSKPQKFYILLGGEYKINIINIFSNPCYIIKSLTIVKIQYL